MQIHIWKMEKQYKEANNVTSIFTSVANKPLELFLEVVVKNQQSAWDHPEHAHQAISCPSALKRVQHHSAQHNSQSKQYLNSANVMALIHHCGPKYKTPSKIQNFPWLLHWFCLSSDYQNFPKPALLHAILWVFVCFGFALFSWCFCVPASWCPKPTYSLPLD